MSRGPLAMLMLPITGAEGEDVWCSCIVCGKPSQIPALPPGWPVSPTPLGPMHGPPVEYLVKVQSADQTTWRGLHRECWGLNQKAGG